MDIKKTFTEPTCEVTLFAVEDIIATSSWDTWELDYIGEVDTYAGE